MKLYLPIAVIFFLIFTANARGSSELHRVTKAADGDSIQMFLSFDTIPKYEYRRSERRLDIVMYDTVTASDFTIFTADETIVKILTVARDSSKVLSLYFRYPPQTLEFQQSDQQTLVIDILPGNRFSKTYDEVAKQLSGITILERENQDYSNPLLRSPYPHNWKRFFDSYEAPVSTHAPVTFTLPVFPLIQVIVPRSVSIETLLGNDILALGNRASWVEAVPLLEQQITNTIDVESKKLLALTYGEVLIRTGNYEGAYKQLYLLERAYRNEKTGVLASYLLALLHALFNDPYTADFKLRDIADLVPPDHPLAPYYNITLTETSIATDQIEQLRNTLERSDIAYPADLLKIRELRQADLLALTDRKVPALVAYRLVSRKLDLQSHTFSLNEQCSILYEEKVWRESLNCYRSLASQLTDRNQLGMAYFRAAMSSLKLDSQQNDSILEFSRIEDTFPLTEAGFKAALKRIDLRYLTGSDRPETVRDQYRSLAETSHLRSIAEEALFKEAVLYHLQGNDQKSIELTMSLLRNFRSGPIITHAEALLIGLLPGEMKRLIDQGQPEDALILAKQNKRYFDRQWLEDDLFVDIALAYERVGIYQQALDIFLSLIERSSKEKKEQLYLPLTRIALEKGDYSLVEDFALQYNFHYPNGRYINEILLLRLKALYAASRFDQAISLLPDPLPSGNEFPFLAATLYFGKGLYPTVVDTLKELMPASSLPDEQRFMLAESLFQAKQEQDAASLFPTLVDISSYRGQSLYRLSQVARQNNKQQEALNLLTKLSETTEDSRWKRLAERELKLAQLSPPTRK